MRDKHLKRIFANLLSFVCVATVFVFSSCQNDSNSSSSDTSGLGSENILPPSTSSIDGTHSFKAEKTNEYIVKNFINNDYKIVISKDASTIEMTAANELSEFLYLATEIAFPIITDDNLSAGGKFFSIGENDLSKNAGVEFDYDILKSQGYIIKTVGQNIYMGGAGDYGSLYSVYGLAEHLLGYDYYYTDSMKINRGLTELPLYNYDVVEVPDIEYRDATYAYVTASAQVCNRYRMMTRDAYICPVNESMGHNVLKWFGVDDNLESHPGWFNDEKDPKQLCFTAHGNSDERAAMLAYGVKVLKEALIQSPDKPVVLLCCEDNKYVCDCDACTDAKEYYGSDSGAMVAMINDIKRAIDEWFKQDGAPYKRDLKIAFYAYLGYETAPTQNIRCEDGVVPYVAPIHADYMVPLTHKANIAAYTQIEKWKAISEDVHFYLYDTNYTGYFTPYNTFESMQENYRYVASSGSSCMHNLGQGNQPNISTGFSVLKVYLQSKLGWNVNADIKALTDSFFDGYYDVAAEWMRKYFEEYRMQSVIQHDVVGYSGMDTIYRDVVKREYWPKQLLERWIGYMDKAMESIEVYKETNLTLYRQLYNHIAAERIDLYYLYVEIYSNYIEESLKQNYKLLVRDDANNIGLKYFRENPSRGAITLLWSSWKI